MRLESSLLSNCSAVCDLYLHFALHPFISKKNESGAGWDSLRVPTFKSVKSSSAKASVSQRTAAIIPDITAYLKGSSSSTHISSTSDGE
jgi:hypothetical protein